MCARSRLLQELVGEALESHEEELGRSPKVRLLVGAAPCAPRGHAAA